MKRSRECLELAVAEINACFAIESSPSLSSQVTKEITKAETDILTADDSIAPNSRTSVR